MSEAEKKLAAIEAHLSSIGISVRLRADGVAVWKYRYDPERADIRTAVDDALSDWDDDWDDDWDEDWVDAFDDSLDGMPWEDEL